MSAPPPFAELSCKSNFSFLQSASHPGELVRQAHALGYTAIAITDECSVAGAVRAHEAAQAASVKLIIGAEFRLHMADASPLRLVLLAPDRQAYGQLCRLITRARRRAPKGSYHLPAADLQSVAACLALWSPDAFAGPIGNGPNADDAAIALPPAALAAGDLLRRHCPRLWIAAGVFLDGRDHLRLAGALRLALHFKVPVVAANQVLMHSIERKPMLDLLTAIRLRRPVADLGERLTSNAERRLRSREALARLYPAEWLAETVRIADACRFSLDELRYEYPQELTPPGWTAQAWLRRLTWQGARVRWPDSDLQDDALAGHGQAGGQGAPDSVKRLIEHELKLIDELDYAHYFLTVTDLVRFARERGILCQGRGSAANSAVCYCLGVTEVDPARQHVLFERFINRERREPPDIDIDFEHERREEVIKYIYGKYGRERAALTATVISYRPRSALRDVGKALGLDADFVGRLAGSLAWWDGAAEMGERIKAAGADPASPLMRHYLALVEQILGFPRHLSQHVGGFVISAGPLDQLVPVENAAMAERTVIQWDKNDLESLGLLKVDVLGLGMLTAIRKSLDLVNGLARNSDRPALTLASIPDDDPDTYAMLQRGDSIGVFQVESRAQIAMLPRLRPASFYDLVIEVAIVRPGPIQGDMVHPYLRRRAGEEPVDYPNEDVRRVLERTLGVPIFQEQVIELAMVAAGFSAGEADALRRAMAAWQRRGGLEPFEARLIAGMQARGHSLAFACRLFEQIKGFGEYGFPESHAASFALLVYVSAWLKRHQPAAFYAGLLNSQPMGFYSPAQLVQDAHRHGVSVLPVDVQRSGWDFRLQAASQDPDASRAPALRVGLRQVKGLDLTRAERIEAGQPFRDIDDLARRARLDSRSLGFLARAGALASLSGHRYQAHWDAAGVADDAPLWRAASAHAPYATEVTLAAPDVGENVQQDYRYLGLSLGPHPMALLRGKRRLKGRRTAAGLLDCRHGQRVRVAGLVTCRQRPGTATGVLFITLEDETGNINLVVWQRVLARYRAALLQAELLLVHGALQREREVTHVIVDRAEDATSLLDALSSRPGRVQTRVRQFR